MTYDEMQSYCEKNRNHETRFCRLCAGCSGPATSNLARDWDVMQEHPGITIYRGGSFGSCRFEVQDK